jgi:hypothetical protein
MSLPQIVPGQIYLYRSFHEPTGALQERRIRVLDHTPHSVTCVILQERVYRRRPHVQPPDWKLPAPDQEIRALPLAHDVDEVSMVEM